MSINEELEELIDKAGRDAVFALVRAKGWGSGPCDAPPEWVWKMAVAQLLEKRLDISKSSKH